MLSYNEVIFCLFEKHFQGDVSHLKKNLMKMVITFWRKNSFPFQVYVHNIIIYVFKYCLSTENNYIGIKLKVCSCNYIQIKACRAQCFHVQKKVKIQCMFIKFKFTEH